MSQNIAIESAICGVGHQLARGDHEVKVNLSKTTGDSDSNSSNAVKRNKLRRAFSMPRNPFRLSSRRNKNKDECVEKFIMNPVMEGSSENDVIPITEYRGDRKSGCIGVSSDGSGGDGSGKKVFRRSSWKKFITRIAQQMTSVNIGAKQHVTDRVPPLSGYQWAPDQTPGVTGLKNHGNTCFMNAVLQCLSHTDILAEYFVLDQYKADLKRRNKINSRKFGTKGELTEQLALVLKALWTCRDTPEHSTSFKAVVDRYGSQFRSSTQHDAQEFLFWLLDKVHEDLNTATKRKYKTIKNNYGRPDEVIAAETLANHIRCNNSFVQAVFQAQFRSSLSCPRCHKQSNTFDPFHCISVQLPQLAHQPVFVTVLYASQHPRQVKLGLGVPPGAPIIALREQLQADTGIPLERIILAEIGDSGFSRIFCDSYPMLSVCDTDPIYCIETPEISNEESTQIILCIANVTKHIDTGEYRRFGTPFCIKVNRDVSYTELQKLLLKEMSGVLKTDVFTYSTPLTNMFKIRLQDPSADPDTYLEPCVEHPLFTEMIDLALSVLPTDAGPSNIKLLLEWEEAEKYFVDMSDPFVEHASVSQLKERLSGNASLTLEQCLDHYTKAETLSTEDAWRCPHCQKYLPVVKTLGLWSLPDILVIHFKRFRQQQLKGPQSAKLTTMVKFPLHGFDMSPHLARTPNTGSNGGIDENWSPWKKMKRKDFISSAMQKENKYDLYAVCYHQGETLETGHYTAACKNPYDQQWYKFDDQRVTHVPDDDITNQIVNNEAYILFYQRRKIDTAECSGTSSSSGDHWVSRIAVPSTQIMTSVSMSTNTSMSDVKLCEQSDIPLVIELPEEEHQTPIKTENIIGPDLNISELVEQIKPQIEDVEIDIVNMNIENQIETKSSNNENLNAIESLEIPQQIVSKDIIEESQKNENYEVQTYEIAKESKTLTPVKTVIIHNETKLREAIISEKKPSSELINRPSSTISTNWSRAFDDSLDNSRQSICSASSRKECDTISMIRGASSCSKDTLLFIDQQGHSLIDDDDTLLGNSRSLWISPVASHKLITVSPKN